MDFFFKEEFKNWNRSNAVLEKIKKEERENEEKKKKEEYNKIIETNENIKTLQRIRSFMEKNKKIDNRGRKKKIRNNKQDEEFKQEISNFILKKNDNENDKLNGCPDLIPNWI